MSDTAAPSNSANKKPEAIFSIQKLYVTDISLESPNTPMSFMENGREPEFEVHFRNEAKGFDNGFYEATLTVTAKALAGEQTLFLVELTQAGIFQIEHVPDEELDPILGIGCPTVLFPYLREAMTDLTTRAGFPPLLLQPINFEAIFMQQRENKQSSHRESTVIPEDIPENETKH